MPLRHVQVEFLGDSRVAIASLDDLAFPETGKLERRKFHLTIDAFPVDAAQGHISQTQFETESGDSRIAVLPSGHSVVSVSRDLLVLDESLNIKVRSTLDRVCGSEVELPAEEGYGVALYAASEEIAVVAFQPLKSRTVPYVDPGHWCWFSTSDMRPLGKAEFGLNLFSTARDFLVYTKGSGTVSISPRGTRRLTLPSTNPPCKLPVVLQSFPEFSLLHAEDASEVICRKGAIAIVRGDRVSSIKLPDGDGFWYLLANAFNAPLAAFVSGGARVPPLGGPPTGQADVRMVNYDTGVWAEVPRVVSAISPSGRYFASLQGSALFVYEMPIGLRGNINQKIRRPG
jgi:uncharacterized protein (AIM24 family)